METLNPKHPGLLAGMVHHVENIRPRAARFWLRWLVVACIVPAWLLAAGVSTLSYQRERAALVHSAQLAAKNLLRATERELACSIALLSTLAAAPAIDAGNYAALREQIVEAQRAASAQTVVLLDRDLQMLALSSRPLGAPLGRLPHDRFPSLWSTAKPDVSNLFFGSQTDQPLAAAAVPVLRKGQVIARAEMVFSPERFSRLIAEQNLPVGWAAAVVGRDSVAVARASGRPGEANDIGTPEQLKTMAGRGPDCDRRTAGDLPVTACFARSTDFGWTALVTVPDELLTATLRTALLEYTFGAALLLIAGLLLANRMGRSITSPVRALVDPAMAIGRGEAATIPETSLREANEVALALRHAQTLLRQRDDARREAEARLRNSESRLRLALEAGQVGDWEVDIASGRVRHSLRHDQCFGYTEPVANWNVGSFFSHLHPDDRHLVMLDRARTAQDGAYQVECRVIWPDGSVHWVALRGRMLVEDGAVARDVGVVIDITERKMVEEVRLRSVQLEAENRQAMEASRLKSEFLSSMSHELRTPLNAVIGFADILCSDAAPQDPLKRQQFLGHIASSGRHLLGLINDLLDLSKVEAGKMAFSPARVKLSSLARDVADMMLPETTRKQIDLRVQTDPAVDDVELDPNRLKQVMYNFLSNAVKFTSSGGRVVLSTMADGPGHWRLEVEDTGLGISESDQAKLFAPFQQVNAGSGKSHQGTGLGLSLTLRLVELQGGSVGLRSTPGVGSVFHARLPRSMRAAGLGTQADVA